MTAWSNLYRSVASYTQELDAKGCDLPFFRGHADSRWVLKPGIARGKDRASRKELKESRVYYDFISLSGPLLSNKSSSWHTLFEMQHHGIPTRLLDWTLSFANAVYFAVKEKIRAPKNGCIWVLDPYALNKTTCNDATILTPPDDFEGSYYENFITKEKTFGHDAVAINPIRVNTRQVAQESTFTVSGNLSQTIDSIAPEALKSFILPHEAKEEALEFLRLAGVNEYRLFPDLDGIARHIRNQHF
jgi:hypothetical protein